MAISKRGQIIDLISHELKTPTVPILGYCEMLLNPKFGKLTNDQYDAVKEIMKNILELQIGEHTSELSHITISYAVFCLKKKKNNTH